MPGVWGEGGSNAPRGSLVRTRDAAAGGKPRGKGHNDTWSAEALGGTLCMPAGAF